MKEYSILVKQGTGKAYIHSTYKDYFEAVASLQIIADYEDECHRMYYVDNDFFNNKYSYITDNLKYICLQVREVSDWE